MDASDVPAWLTADAIASPLARLLGHDVRSIPAWTCSRLTGGAGAALGVWHLTGTACLDDGNHKWALVLKGWPPPGTTGNPIGEAEAARERALYRSGHLATLPGGIRAPVCHGEVDSADGSTWIWFEQVSDHTSGPWPLDRYIAIARVLGRFNGAYLMGLPPPDVPELSRGWLCGWLAPVDAAMRRLEEVRELPLVQQICPAHVVDLYARVWEACEAAHAALDRLPKGFCHLDAFRRTLLISRTPDGAEEIIAIDWEFAGDAAIGEELVPLVIGSAIFHETPPVDLSALGAAAIESYVDGLARGRLGR